MFSKINRSDVVGRQSSLGENDKIGVPTRISSPMDKSGYSLTSSNLGEIERGMKKPILLAKNDKEKDTSSAHKEAAKEVAKDSAWGAGMGGLASGPRGAISGGLIGAANGVRQHCGSCHDE